MPVKKWASKWLTEEAKRESPHRYKLAERLEKDVKDEDDADLLNQALDKLEQLGRD